MSSSDNELNVWYDMATRRPNHDDQQLRRIFFVYQINNKDIQGVVITMTENSLQEELEVGAFSDDSPYSHWMEWFPTTQTFQMSLASLQTMEASAIFPTPPS